MTTDTFEDPLLEWRGVRVPQRNVDCAAYLGDEEAQNLSDYRATADDCDYWASGLVDFGKEITIRSALVLSQILLEHGSTSGDLEDSVRRSVALASAWLKASQSEREQVIARVHDLMQELPTSPESHWVTGAANALLLPDIPPLRYGNVNPGALSGYASRLGNLGSYLEDHGLTPGVDELAARVRTELAPFLLSQTG